jgi:hypothetical protein
MFLHHFFQRFNLGWEQVAQHRHGCAGDRATVRLRTRAYGALGFLGPLHRDVLCDAEQWIGPSGGEGVELGVSNEIARHLLPARTRENCG